MFIDTDLRQLKHICEVGDFRWWELVHRVIPENVMVEVLSMTGAQEKRRRKLTAKVMLLFVILMGLFTEECLEQVYACMVEGLRFWHPVFTGILQKKVGFAMPDIALAPNLWSICSAEFVVR